MLWKKEWYERSNDMKENLQLKLKVQNKVSTSCMRASANDVLPVNDEGYERKYNVWHKSVKTSEE